MAFKFVAFAALLAAANAGVIGTQYAAAPLAYSAAPVAKLAYSAPVVAKRTVEYTADPIHGFNAVVHREPLGVKVAAPVVAKVATPVHYAAAPVAKVAYAAAPVAYAASPVAYAAPVAKIAAPVGYAAAPAQYYHH
ncbi:PREDICTED: cuticle protein 21-like [Nicrophorus vespilloides]|uniref:Cuticle protein 21-like n=1 Tax=Nicrophorus vespilloides TaxID=110193 RepID=A0ABM1MI09_NICVS|nr:PREDICTED: cuticle protein 21-like [Nicrophorus vespilloides]